MCLPMSTLPSQSHGKGDVCLVEAMAFAEPKIQGNVGFVCTRNSIVSVSSLLVLWNIFLKSSQMWSFPVLSFSSFPQMLQLCKWSSEPTSSTCVVSSHQNLELILTMSTLRQQEIRDSLRAEETHLVSEPWNEKSEIQEGFFVVGLKILLEGLWWWSRG